MITVVGCDGSPLPPEARDRLKTAVLVAGGRRHLDLVHPPDDAERVVMGDVTAALDRMDTADGDVVVLASGDPGFFGILRALRERGHDPDVLPAVSSVARAFATAGLSWDDAVVVSAHGRDPRTAVNACRAMAKVAVLTSPTCGPASIGAALTGWNRVLHVAERLGTPDERVTRCTPAEATARDWAQPNVVLSLAGTAGAPAVPLHNQPAAPGRWAREDTAYRHRDGMITKWEVRAAVLARLRPTLGTLIWDVGAGSGSVGIECAAQHAAVIAIERDPDSCDLIRHNAGQAGVMVVQATAPEAYDGLPDPDAVFVGGGGLRALTGALDRRPPVLVATYAAVDRAAEARRLLTDAGYEVEGGQLSASRFADLPGGSFRLVAQNPVFILAGRTDRSGR